MDNIRRSLFGYNINEVSRRFVEMTYEQHHLQELNEEQKRRIESLERRLQKKEQQEELIQETILEAKGLSKRLILEAELQAKTIIDEAKQKAKDMVYLEEQRLVKLKAKNEAIRQQKKELQEELLALLDRYKNSFEEINKDQDRLRMTTMTEEEQRSQEEPSEPSGKQIVSLPPKIVMKNASDGRVPLYAIK